MTQPSDPPRPSRPTDPASDPRPLPPNGGTSDPQHPRGSDDEGVGGPADADHAPEDSENTSEGRHDPSNPHHTR